MITFLCILSVVCLMLAFMTDIFISDLRGRSPMVTILSWVWAALVSIGIVCLMTTIALWVCND